MHDLTVQDVEASQDGSVLVGSILVGNRHHSLIGWV